MPETAIHGENSLGLKDGNRKTSVEEHITETMTVRESKTSAEENSFDSKISEVSKIFRHSYFCPK